MRNISSVRGPWPIWSNSWEMGSLCTMSFQKDRLLYRPTNCTSWKVLETLLTRIIKHSNPAFLSLVLYNPVLILFWFMLTVRIQKLNGNDSKCIFCCVFGIVIPLSFVSLLLHDCINNGLLVGNMHQLIMSLANWLRLTNFSLRFNKLRIIFCYQNSMGFFSLLLHQ